MNGGLPVLASFFENTMENETDNDIARTGLRTAARPPAGDQLERIDADNLRSGPSVAPGTVGAREAVPTLGTQTMTRVSGEAADSDAFAGLWQPRIL